MIVRALAASALLALVVLAQQQPTTAERETNWRQDLQFFRASISAPGTTVDMLRGISSRGQKDFAKLYPNETFDAAIDALESGIPKLSDAELVLGLMRVVASAHVAHNSVNMPVNMGFFGRLPLGFYWYPDGLAVTAASSDYTDALGARVLRIGPSQESGMTPDELLMALAPYLSHENDVWLKGQVGEFLRPRAVLDHFGLLSGADTVTITLQKPGAPPFTIFVKPMDPRTPRLTFTEFLHVPTPLFRSQQGKDYWYRYLDDSKTFYIQYNACRNDPKLRFADFARQALAEADAHAVKRVVVDLRLNGGGDSRVIAPLKTGLAARAAKLGPLYVLIGPGTFSSAEDNALELKRDLQAILVGEPAGGKPTGYGEVKTFTLPHSKLVVRFTSKHFGSEKDDDRAALAPDIAAPRPLADALAGRDPALDAAISASGSLGTKTDGSCVEGCLNQPHP